MRAAKAGAQGKKSKRGKRSKRKRPLEVLKGVDMVAYSGGKCLRGPQCAGILLGRKDILQAAWLNSAPQEAACSTPVRSWASHF